MGDIRLDPVEGEDGVSEIVHVRGTEGAVFLSQLQWKDLKRLREAVKKQYMRFYPVEFFTDREADKIIESLGPVTAEKLIKRLVDQKEGKAGWL